MTPRELAEKIIDKSSKRWIQDVGNGFSCNLDILKEDLEYEISSALEAQEKHFQELMNKQVRLEVQMAKEKARAEGYAKGQLDERHAAMPHRKMELVGAARAAYESCAKIAESYLMIGAQMNPQFPQIAKNLAEQIRQAAKELK